MSEPRQRRWFQFHLSTAILMMFLLSLLIGANLNIQCYIAETRPGTESQWSKVDEMGWPFPFVVRQRKLTTPPDKVGLGSPMLSRENLSVYEYFFPANSDVSFAVNRLNLALTLFFSLASFCLVSVAAEWAIRRHESRRLDVS